MTDWLLIDQLKEILFNGFVIEDAKKRAEFGKKKEKEILEDKLTGELSGYLIGSSAETFQNINAIAAHIEYRKSNGLYTTTP